MAHGALEVLGFIGFVGFYSTNRLGRVHGPMHCGAPDCLRFGLTRYPGAPDSPGGVAGAPWVWGPAGPGPRVTLPAALPAGCALVSLRS